MMETSHVTGLVNSGDKNSSEIPASVLLSAQRTNIREGGVRLAVVKIKAKILMTVKMT